MIFYKYKPNHDYITFVLCCGIFFSIGHYHLLNSPLFFFFSFFGGGRGDFLIGEGGRGTLLFLVREQGERGDFSWGKCVGLGKAGWGNRELGRGIFFFFSFIREKKGRVFSFGVEGGMREVF